MSDEWRGEADDEWLAAHRSQNFDRLRRRLRRAGLLGNAFANAELGPFGGAPRNPKLSVGGRTYAVIRYTHQWIAYTSIQVDLQRCRRCGHRLVEVHRLSTVRADGVRVRVGTVRACRRCAAESWMFTSRMPAIANARNRSRKVVL
jgi:hypothetical protein